MKLTKAEWITLGAGIVVLAAAYGISGAWKKPVYVINSISNKTMGGVPQAQGSNISKDPKVQIIDVAVGNGAEAKVGSKVSVQYTGMLEDGKVFDSSVPRGTPFEFQLGAGNVILGWEKGVAGMKVGGKRRLVISPEYGYGAQGYPGVIPGNATLYFDVELVGVK